MADSTKQLTVPERYKKSLPPSKAKIKKQDQHVLGSFIGSSQNDEYWKDFVRAAHESRDQADELEETLAQG